MAISTSIDGWTQSVENHAQHLLFGRWFVGPELKLLSALFHEHLHAGDRR